MNPLKTHRFCFNPQDNRGESLILETYFFLDGGISIEQELILTSYFNSASFNLGESLFTPKMLRKLADQLEKEAKKLGVTFNGHS